MGMLFVKMEVNHTKTICMHSEDLPLAATFMLAVCMCVRILYNIIILLDYPAYSTYRYSVLIG